MGFLQLLDELLLGNIGNVIVVDRDLVYNSENSQQHWMGNILSKTNKLGSSNLEEAIKRSIILNCSFPPWSWRFPTGVFEEYEKNLTLCFHWLIPYRKYPGKKHVQWE